MSFPRPQPATKSVQPHLKDKSLIEASKAIYDAIIPAVYKELESVESKMLIQFGKMLESELQKTLASSQIEGKVEGRFKGLADAISNQVKDLNNRTEALADRHEIRLKNLADGMEERHKSQIKSITDTYEKRLVEMEANHKRAEADLVNRVAKMLEGEICKRLDAIAGQSADNLDSLHKSFQLGQESAMDSIKALVASLPAPQVSFNLPPEAIAIKMLPSQVQVDVHPAKVDMQPVFHIPEQKAIELNPVFNVPEKAFHLQLEAPPVTVNVPEQKSIINVQVKDLPTPVVNFTPPPPRLLEKKHFYDEHGRPERTVEQEIK